VDPLYQQVHRGHYQECIYANKYLQYQDTISFDWNRRKTVVEKEGDLLGYGPVYFHQEAYDDENFYHTTI
jgi:hypothetical protein